MKKRNEPRTAIERSSSGPPWVVLLRMQAAARFKQDEGIRIQASAASTAPIHEVWLHNDCIGPVEDGLSHRGLRFDVSGGPESLQEAASILGGIGGAYANLLSVAGNAFVGEPRLSVIYKLPAGDVPGQFFQRVQVNEPSSPPSVVRTLPLAQTGNFINKLEAHSEKDRLFRSCAHYAAALRNWHEFEALVAAESLWIAAETLGPIILRRLMAAQAMTKEQLAEHFGYKPDPAGGTQHLYKLDAHVLREHVFAGFTQCFNNLKKASHGFEHGFADFDKIRSMAETVKEEAARHVRSTILRECDLAADDLTTLNSKPFDEAQGGWDPYIEIEGTLHPRGDTQPTQFIGVQAHAYVDAITDSLDDKRTVSIKLDGKGFTIPEDIIARTGPTTVWMPGTKYTAIKNTRSTLEVRHQDGNVERRDTGDID